MPTRGDDDLDGRIRDLEVSNAKILTMLETMETKLALKLIIPMLLAGACGGALGSGIIPQIIGAFLPK